MEDDRRQEEPNERYRCGWEGCQQQLASQQQLVVHVTSQHVQLASSTYRCLWRGCSRRRQGFNARYKMFVHIRTHTKERPHVCPDCGKGFSRQENLKIHKRSHTGEKPYACTFEGCDRAYSNSSDRFKHTRTHYVDRPYSCRHPGCSKSYTDPSSLRKHMKANGHGRPSSPAATPPPGGRPEKLSRGSTKLSEGQWGD
ncbi:Zinc finger protein GLIS2 [Amphibalanus amphitrite]|uniref:Zinc finger protein GLIS2 n=1 Tax=Amphibalanus amphitrite TaxID=1232801 RepID=A0A6A4VB73_AMPAM|nr:Zinc finger protein GLIS2 [Amphibalanus amphitrite]